MKMVKNKFNFAENIGDILRLGNKQNTYKIALLRSINDALLAFPDYQSSSEGISIPIELLAEHWFSYYWPFIESEQTEKIYQAPESKASDLRFRDDFVEFKNLFIDENRTNCPSDGWFLKDVLAGKQNNQHYSKSLKQKYIELISFIRSKGIPKPIKYTDFLIKGRIKKPLGTALPRKEWYTDRSNAYKYIHLTENQAEVFRRLYPFIESLCVREWCKFIDNYNDGLNRGEILKLIDKRPDDRESQGWLHNELEFLEKQNEISFKCPWSAKELSFINSEKDNEIDIDHIVPLNVYPANELWNLVPANSNENSGKHTKIPSQSTLEESKDTIIQTYNHYLNHNYSQRDNQLSELLKNQTAYRFNLSSPNEVNAEIIYQNLKEICKSFQEKDILETF